MHNYMYHECKLHHEKHSADIQFNMYTHTFGEWGYENFNGETESNVHKYHCYKVDGLVLLTKNQSCFGIEVIYMYVYK